ncbi:class C sortase [Lactobacillus nasalidis]|uniref:Class C sortase n=1 Tax=Lactobacillus nasalidis TaxID=2797258 RepID=A0ABQ3W4C9_9LACO|nr:class C sortase [Lactobacillus nasalidis]GHV98339.1 class C sortase [Lactobacillus nasalidis]GHV99754.1 class C sortase [Lactobacillus nasalidis]GHW00529.1 class C sortase [Lactobacillus nasalidis]
MNKQAKKQQNNKKGPIWPFILLLVVGLGLLGYPLSTQAYNFWLSHQKVQSFQKAANNLSSIEVKKRLRLARAYNASLLSPGQQSSVSDPFSKSEKKAGVAAYAKMLELHENIGYIDLPKLHQELPIYAGTSESVLQKGIGHLAGSSLPVGGKSTRAVLTGHRGLPNSRLFTDLPRLKKGDVFYVHNLGQVLAYKVYKIEVIKPTQVDKLKIVKGKDLCTLMTCTPYMINTHRLLVTGYRIPYNPKSEKKANEQSQNRLIWIAIAVLLPLLAIIIFFWHRRRRKKKQAGKQAGQAEKKE